MKQYTSTAIKDGRWWVVQCDQEPGALSQVARLDQAAEHQREAISMVTGIDESEIDVEVRPELDETLGMALAIVAEKRQQAETLQKDASSLFAAIAQALSEDGLSLRDAAVVLGVSHQRVAQLLSEEVKSTAGTRTFTSWVEERKVGGSRTAAVESKGPKSASRSAISGRYGASKSREAKASR